MKNKQQSYSHPLLLLITSLGLLVFFVSCAKPDERMFVPHPALAEIDSLLWSHPDSAFVELQRFAESPDVDRLEICDGHYFQLLLSELLYKNDYAQTNREELLQAMGYFDSLVMADAHGAYFKNARGASIQQGRNAFLDARCHYINGVGYYETDSVVAACEEYLKAVELMRDRFNEKELVGKKAQFMALAYTRLLSLFSDCYLPEQAIAHGKASLVYYERQCSKPGNTTWVLNEIGAMYEMMKNLDSADYYYRKALITLNDTCGMGYRDVLTRLTLLSYDKDGNAPSSLCQLQSLLSKSENENEYLSRALCVGSILYSEEMYDSAWYYLNIVYQNTNNINVKKQTAVWLTEICKKQGRDSEASAYTDLLVSFSDISEQQSLQQSRLTKLCNDHGTKKQARLYLNKRNQFQRVIVMVFFVGLLLFVVGFIIIHFRNKHKINQLQSDLETKIEKERYAHRIQQKALSGRLKRSNSIVRKHQNEKTTTAAFQIENPQEKQLNFLAEEICRYILSLFNDKNKTVKSTISYKEYVDMSLNDLQKAQLIKAAEQYYGSQIENLRIRYPSLNEKDMLYCYLCLLGLNNTQISALLHLSKSSVWDREKRIKKIFGTKESLSVYFHRLVLCE